MNAVENETDNTLKISSNDCMKNSSSKEQNIRSEIEKQEYTENKIKSDEMN